VKLEAETRFNSFYLFKVCFISYMSLFHFVVDSILILEGLHKVLVYAVDPIIDKALNVI